MQLALGDELLCTGMGSLSSLPFSCRERVVPMNFACGACGRVRCANSSKSGASSRKVTVPGSCDQVSALCVRVCVCVCDAQSLNKLEAFAMIHHV